MTQQRNINPWHVLTLVLAFIAGGATFANTGWLSHLPFNQDVRVSEHGDEVGAPLEGVEVQNEAKNSVVTEDAPVVAARGPIPDEIPLFIQNEIEDIREQTELAREKIDELEQTVAELSDELENGRESFENGSVGTGQSTPSEQQPAATAAANQNRGRRNRGLNRDALVQAGIESSTIDLLEQRQNQQALARLDLLDRAAREGYSGTERLENELDELRDSGPDLREELGDSAYDQYLFNSGSNNRVRVSSIISGSIADIAGIQLGDIIYQYGPTRVFTVRSLVAAIREGVRDEPVVVNLVREGQPLIIDVTRAPLGVTLNGVREEPF